MNSFPNFGMAALAVLALPATLMAAPPERGFFSTSPAAKWEQALVSGNGTHGAMVFGAPGEENVIINHGLLYLPLHPPLPAPETSTILPEIRSLMADGEFQKAADRVVELADRNGYSGKHWTDPFIPACDLKVEMPPKGKVRDYGRSVDFTTGVASVSWSDERGSWSRRLFVSRKDDVIVMSIKGPEKAAVNCNLTLATRPFKGTGGWGPEKMFKDGVRDIQRKSEGDLLIYQGQFTRAYEGGLQGYGVVAKVLPKGGTMKAEGETISIHGADEVLILMRVSLSRDAGKSGIPPVASDLAALPADFDKLLAPHAAIHGGIFNRVRLDLGATPTACSRARNSLRNPKPARRIPPCWRSSMTPPATTSCPAAAH